MPWSLCHDAEVIVFFFDTVDDFLEVHSVRGLTFEFTRPAEAGVVSPACDDPTAGTRRAYNACRSGSGVQRGVRPRRCVRDGV